MLATRLSRHSGAARSHLATAAKLLLRTGGSRLNAGNAPFTALAVLFVD
jgi:hypothetical protein